ncbi:DUF58 domain-containing protein [Sporichthya brevicatena]|uniref:DUF58 domain-containing protein n=1 Tax=Sporichthya brevicatena TaxID=171442 RepID=A0ABN1GTG3_9ACTN
MRIFSGLTLRGRCFLVAGVAALGCALVLGQQDVLRVAILLISLPLVCAAVVFRTQHKLSTSRVIEPMRVPAGEEARVSLRVDNTSLAPSGLLLAEDSLPRGMSARPRFVIDRLEPRGKREVFYRVRSQVRGKFPIGPLRLRLADPFGMCEISRSYAGTDDLIVIPVVEPVPFVVLGGEWTGGSESHPSSIPSAGEDDIGTREYRYGDALHRVHWRSTARRGELMVRREEHPRQSQATLLVDVRAEAHAGEGLHSSLEWAVSAAASLSIHLIRRGFSLRLLTETGQPLAGMAADVVSPSPDVEGLLLDALAMLAPSHTPTLNDALRGLHRAGSDSLVIALLGDLSEADAAALGRRRQGTQTAIALMLRPLSWTPGGAEARTEEQRRFEHNIALLRNGGWRAVPVSAGDRLPDVWLGVARGGPVTGIRPAGVA